MDVNRVRNARILWTSVHQKADNLGKMDRFLETNYPHSLKNKQNLSRPLSSKNTDQESKTSQKEHFRTTWSHCSILLNI